MARVIRSGVILLLAALVLAQPAARGEAAQANTWAGHILTLPLRECLPIAQHDPAGYQAMIAAYHGCVAIARPITTRFHQGGWLSGALRGQTTGSDWWGYIMCSGVPVTGCAIWHETMRFWYCFDGKTVAPCNHTPDPQCVGAGTLYTVALQTGQLHCTWWSTQPGGKPEVDFVISYQAGGFTYSFDHTMQIAVTPRGFPYPLLLQ